MLPETIRLVVQTVYAHVPNRIRYRACGTGRVQVKISLITPAGRDLRNGNRATAERWAGFLRELGDEVVLEETWGGDEPDLMLVLHARRSHPSIRHYANAYPKRPLIVALTGTDLYRDIHSDETAGE